jgi:serine phosphatase RsbU (regulator of sigma subunit)
VRRPVSIYRSLLTSLLIVIALLSGAVLLTTAHQARGAVEAVSQTAIRRTMDEVDAELQRFFDPAKRGMQLIRDWGEQGRLEFADMESFSQALGPVIKNYPQITSLMIANGDGREMMLLHVGGKWITRDSRPEEWGNRTRWSERPSLDEPARLYDKEFAYDCRVRPWYQEAVRARPPSTARETHWTTPYTFKTTKDPGITAVVSYSPPGGGVRVLAFDVMLRDISRFTRSLAPSANGRTVVLTDGGRVLGLPGTKRFEDEGERKQALLKKPDEIGVPVIAAATRVYREQALTTGKPFRFTSDGETWWGGVRSIELASDRHLALAVVVPESDLLGDVAARRIWILGATALVLAFAAWYAMILARRYSEPILALVHESERIRGGDLERGEEIPTQLQEVRKLALAHDEMRIAVGTLLKLERDLQIARKIQQDTFPDRLPKLRGYELEAWSVPADETGGDTYDLVGLRHGSGTGLVVQDDPDTALFLLADATGHGIGPALSVTQVRAMLRMAARSGAPLEEIATHMNEQLCADLADDRFITAWLGHLDAGTNELTSFAAGQAPLLHYVAARDEVVTMKSDAPPLGILESLPVNIKPPIAMERGDLFAVISDGIFEAKNAARDEFGNACVIEVIRKHHEQSPSAILDALRAAVAEFTGAEPQDDDRTAILIKRVGNS